MKGLSSFSLLGPGLALLCSPLLQSLINRTKARWAGRQGQPWMQPYFDLWKLLNKGTVYSSSTSWIFRAGPLVLLTVSLTALFIVPLGTLPSLLSFSGDFLFLIYLLSLARFFIVIAALDTGSSFEGMGASREVFFSALAEPVLMLGIATLSRQTGSLSLWGIVDGHGQGSWVSGMLVGISLFIVLLSENARLPVDDPTTHLELTMIHEVMVLDHGGPDLAFIQYSTFLKLWVFEALLVSVMLPSLAIPYGWINVPGVLGGMVLLSCLIGTVESMMARMRLKHIPKLLVGAGALSAVAFILTTVR